MSSQTVGHNSWLRQEHLEALYRMAHRRACGATPATVQHNTVLIVPAVLQGVRRPPPATARAVRLRISILAVGTGRAEEELAGHPEGALRAAALTDHALATSFPAIPLP